MSHKLDPAASKAVGSKPRDEEAQAPGKDLSRGRRTLIGVAAGICALGVAYGIGWFQRAELTAKAEQKAADLEKQRQTASGEFDAQRDRAIRLEARRRLHLAVMAVDAKNFGIAQEHLDKAATLLERARGKSELDSLTAEIKQTKLDGAQDLAATRTRAQSLVDRFDAVLPPAEP